MGEACLFAPAWELMRHHTGVVIPVFMPPDVDRELSRSLLADTVQGYANQLADPAALCLSVDGEDRGEDVVEELARRYGVAWCCAPRNRGKLQAVRHGIAHLFDNPDLTYLAVVDSDGDHFANELANLVRGADYAHAQLYVEDVMVLGRRPSRHRPLGFLRGELEELADRVLLDALAYDAAISGQPLRLECATALEEFPDFHSGFKLFSRGAAEATFMRPAQLCGATEDAYFRHGCEAVMTVEAMLGGAYLVLVNRSTLNEQPISTFGLLDRERMVADKIIWPCKRLGIPPAFVDQWLRNHMPRLLLSTLAPQGQEELHRIRELVLAEFGMDVAGEERPPWGPLFV